MEEINVNSVAGGKPVKIAEIDIEPDEYCSILYLPVYMRGQGVKIPKRVEPYRETVRNHPTHSNSDFLPEN